MRRADLNALMDRLRDHYGDDAARRVERAADEVHGLDQRYTDTALHHAFAGNADSALVAMKPGDFEKYAARLPEKGYPDYGYFDWDTGADLDYDQYMDYLNTIEHRGGLSDVPFLNVGHEEGADLPYVGAHEGRHRMRAMAKAGKPTGLVMIRPSGRLEESLRHGPTYETAYRDSNQKRQALLDHLAAHDRMVYPQKERDRQDDIRGPEQLPEAFADGGSIPGRELNELGMYSKALEEAKAIRQPKGKLSDLLRYLKGRGVKDSEIKALKLHQDKDEILTKEQLADRIRQRRVKLKAEVRSKKAREDWDNRLSSLELEWKQSRDPARKLEIEKEIEALPKAPMRPSGQYEGYTRKGGDNYTEQLLSIPPSPTGKRSYSVYDKGSNAMLGSFVPTREEAEAYLRNRTDRMVEAGYPTPDLMVREHIQNEDPLYTSGHWPNVPNVLAHIRTKDRITPEGRKVLYGEEFQSDWAQQGRDQGFKPENYDQLQEAAKLANTAAWNAKMAFQNHNQNVRGEYMKANPYPTGDWSLDKKAALDAWEEAFAQHRNAHPDHQRLFDEHQRTDKEARALNDQLFAARKAANGVNEGPYVTDTNDWVDLVLKKHLLDAHKGGYDAVGWAPGEENADHYNQRLKNVKSLHWFDPKVDDDGDQIDTDGFLRAMDEHGNQIAEEYVHPDKLHEMVGKENAKALMEAPEKRVGNRFPRVLDFPDGMPLGGEGMRKFYNEIVRNRMRKLVRGLDPAADVEYAPVSAEKGWHHDVPEGEDPQFYPSEERTTYRPAHLVRITPTMRDKLKGGLEEFRRGGWVDRGDYARGGIADYQAELDSANRMMSPDEEGLLAYPRDRYIDPHYRVGALKGWALNPNLRQDRFLDYPSVNDDIGAPYFNGWNENRGRFRNYADGGSVEREHFEFGGFQDNSRPGQAGDPGNWGAWGNGTEDVSVRDAQAAGLRAGLSRAEVAYGQVPGGLGYRGGSGTSLTNLPELSAANLARAGVFNPGERRVSGNPADAATGMAQPGSVREALGLGKMPEQTQTPEQAVQQVEAQRRQAAAASDPSGFNGLAGGTVALAAFGALPGQHKPGEDMTTPADTGFMSTPEQNSYNRFMDTARNTYMEAGNQSDEGMLGVAFSAPNRTAINYGGIGPGGIDTTGYNDPNASFDENVTRNIYAPKQYSWTNPALNRKTGVVNVDRARDIADAEMAGAPDRAQRAYAAAYAQQFGGAADPTYGAVSYHADYVSPTWRRDAASLGTPTVIGDHTFYGGNPPTATQVAGPGAASVLSTMADPWGFSHMTPVNDLATAPLSWTDRIGAPPATPLGSPRTPTPASAYSVGEDATPLGSPRTPTPATAYAPEGATRTWANPVSVPYSDPGFERPGYDISVYQGVPLADITPVRPAAPTLTEQAYNPLSSIRAPSVVDPFTARKVQTERIALPSEEPSYTRAPYHDTVYDAPAATAAAVAQRMGWHDNVYDAPSAPASPLGSPRTPTPASAYARPEAAPAAPVARPAAPYGTRGNPLSAADMAAVGLGDATPAQLRSYRADIPRGSMISSDSPYYGTRNNPLSDADMAAAGLGDEQSFSKKYLGFRSNDEVDADNKPYKDPETGQWVDPRFSRTPVGMAALGLLGLGLTAVSPPLGIAYGLSALMGKSPLINGADRLASRIGFDGRTTTTDPNAPSAWGSLKSGVQGQSYAPGYDGAGAGRSLSSFNGNSGGNGYRMYDTVPGPVANPIDVKSKKKAAEPKPEPVRPSDWNDMASWQQELWSDTYG